MLDFLFGKKEKKKYTVAQGLYCNKPFELNLCEMTFYSAATETKQQGWAVRASDATPLSLEEANEIAERTGGVVLNLVDTQQYLEEYWRERLNSEKENNQY